MSTEKCPPPVASQSTGQSKISSTQDMSCVELSQVSSKATSRLSVPLLVDAREAARLLAIGRRKLWSLTICGELPSIRIGRAVRYLPGDLAAWIERQKAVRR